ncbi:UpxY family transcription antiterminator [Croceitalea marina]|uniref:UpxY family transcription antiterminator n=1 Tax=Croceitalea marina TaxID=1775166 RepID=A0ABW5MS99_9FLAO
MSFTYGWHVLYVKPRWEQKVFDSLNEISLEAFLPRVKTIRQWSDRKKTILKPLFPSYVFVNIHSSLELHKALSVKGVCAYIRFGREYAIVGDKEIAQIRFIIGEKDITNIETVTELPKIGESKKILYGALAGLECEIIQADNHSKIIVRIDSLRQNIMATIPLHNLERA